MKVHERFWCDEEDAEDDTKNVRRGDVCLTCGARVLDRPLHNDWHNELERQLNLLEFGPSSDDE